MTRPVAPFPWFGGKKRVARVVWEILGTQEEVYVEPFAGSLAVLLARPGGPPRPPAVEIVNDLDHFIVNFWRSVKVDPDGVLDSIEDPITEADLIARVRWLRRDGRERIEACRSDPYHYDPHVAGWWLWGLNCWLGRGYLGYDPGRKLPKVSSRTGIFAAGLATRGQRERRMYALRDRISRVAVACGDWRRVLTPSVIRGCSGDGVSDGAIYLDPPYIGTENCYTAGDGVTIADEVEEWALENPQRKIVISGNAEDYPRIAAESGWGAIHWRRDGGFASSGADREEVIYASPACSRRTGGILDVLSG